MSRRQGGKGPSRPAAPRKKPAAAPRKGNRPAWTEKPGNDSTTLFFNEETVLRTTSREFILDLAIVHATEEVRSIHLYIRRK